MAAAWQEIAGQANKMVGHREMLSRDGAAMQRGCSDETTPALSDVVQRLREEAQTAAKGQATSPRHLHRTDGRPPAQSSSSLQHRLHHAQSQRDFGCPPLDAPHSPNSSAADGRARAYVRPAHQHAFLQLGDHAQPYRQSLPFGRAEDLGNRRHCRVSPADCLGLPAERAILRAPEMSSDAGGNPSHYVRRQLE